MRLPSIAFSVICALFTSVLNGQTVIVTPPGPDPELDPTREMSICDFLNGGLGTVDWDSDGIDNCKDNCLFDRNKDQKDKDNNGVGDACEWRKRADEEWERTGRQRRLTATEPANLAQLVKRSSNVLVVRFVGGGVPQDNFSLSSHRQVAIVRELKGKAKRIPVSIFRGIWVWVPDQAGREVFVDKDLLIFLKNGKLRHWKEPLVFGGDAVNGKIPIETMYYGYELTDRKFGILGVSESRLEELEALIARKRVRK